jgi:hypothetical protein
MERIRDLEHTHIGRRKYGLKDFAARTELSEE